MAYTLYDNGNNLNTDVPQFQCSTVQKFQCCNGKRQSKEKNTWEAEDGFFCLNTRIIFDMEVCLIIDTGTYFEYNKRMYITAVCNLTLNYLSESIAP